MGQHKSNPTAKLAKEGAIEPKPRPMGKVAHERLMYAKVREMMWKAAFGFYDEKEDTDV